jgi:hypothetical protein
LAYPLLLVGYRTYETSLLVEEAISEELPYSGKVHLPTHFNRKEGHSHQPSERPCLKANRFYTVELCKIHP